MADRAARDAEVTAYAAGRWPHVVRTLVLLGAPPTHAPSVAADAVSRILERRDEDADPDVALAVALVEAWESDRTAWWHELPDEDAVAGLDVLAPVVRARVALRAGMELTDEQLDDVLGPGAERPVQGEPAAAPQVEAGEPLLAEARARRADRVRRRRRTAVGVLAAVVVVVGGSAAWGLRPGGSAPAPQAAPPTETYAGTVTSVEVDMTDLRPNAWSDGRRVHLGDRTFDITGVVGLAVMRGGVVATDRSGTVLFLRSSDTVDILGQARRGSVAVSDPRDSLVAWIDRRTGGVAVRTIDSEAGTEIVDARGASEVVAIDKGRVYVAGSGLGAEAVVPAGGALVQAAPEGLLDIAADTVLTSGAVDGVQVTSKFGLVSQLPGIGGTLADDGRYLLTRDPTVAGQPPSRVVDLASNTVVDLALPLDRGVVVDAALDGDRVTFVLRTPQGIQYPPDRPRSRGFIPGFTLVTCDLLQTFCLVGDEVFGEASRPVLAR